MSSTIPWMVGVGNHERFYDWAAVSNRYTMPYSEYTGEDDGDVISSNGNFWYTYTYGNSRVISISSEHDFSLSSPQRVFVIKALDNAIENRDLFPWIVVTVHKPVRCSGDGAHVVFGGDLDDLLREYDVDLIVEGHMHLYERVSPVSGDGEVLFPVVDDDSGIDKYYSEGKGPVS